ncbi:AraC family transcriptional regulator [Lysobacter yananisis]|uniref:Transcriptional regulator, AraC family n=2 Tax=Lysobacter TaxID=68 RepID=A0A0S2DLI9_LYSEN|nr:MULTISPECIES: AraC family transcriptional regulator [Lysobacter]ALN59422.1 transcriptional regulator, AraC family [Lysobacter enzymogenes]WMT05636.1 AraC family transcriptional regulator [Lysobacter yananisis]
MPPVKDSPAAASVADTPAVAAPAAHAVEAHAAPATVVAAAPESGRTAAAPARAALKPGTRDAHHRRIQRAVALIEQAIAAGEEPPELGRLAEAAAFSPFHFHRVYRAMTGETTGQTVARLRLLQGLRVLADGGRSVTDAALAVGYQTPQAFTRALRQGVGGTPSELRAEPERLWREIDRLAQPPAPEHGEAAPLRVEVVSVEPFQVAALRVTGAYPEQNQGYGRLFGWAAQNGLLDSLRGLYGIPLDDRRDVPPQACAFDCMLALGAPFGADAGEGIRLQVLGGGRYARVRLVGAFDGLEALTDALLARWLPESGESLRDAPLFHEYLDDPDETPEAVLRTDIYLPLA